MTNYKKKIYKDDPAYDFKGSPKGDDIVKPEIAFKAIKDLPKSSVTFRVDPNTNMMPHAIPYTLINAFNQKVGGSYSGEPNLDAGNIQQYANSNGSGFLAYADFMRLKTTLNYRYLPIIPNDNQVGYGLVDESIKACSEAASLLGATTFTSLQINNYKIETDMCMGNLVGEATDEVGVFRYTGLAAVLYACSIYYQIFWQNVSNTYVWHNSFRLKQGTMIRSSWNRETPILNALFGLFNKSSWLNLLDGISLSLQGEYIDKQFITQCAMLNAMPSRRSNSITDPVLELQTSLVMPKVFRVIYTVADQDAYIFNSDDVSSFLPAINSLNNLLAAESVMAWARNFSTDSTNTANKYFNDAKTYLDSIIQCMAIVKRDFSFLREALDVMTRTGTVGWAKDYRPIVTKDSDAELYDMLLVDDIFRLVVSGANSLEFNNTTKRWTTFSLWSMYKGIPEYDSKQGGSFLTMSCKDIVYSQDDDDNRYYLPIALNFDGKTLTCVSRDGVQMDIETYLYTMSEHRVLARLVPLQSQANLKIRVPVLKDTAINNKTITSYHRSAMYKTLCQVFGLGGITVANNRDIALDPDIVAVYQIEIDDITNISINYARTNAPIRSSGRETSFLGFFGTIK